MEQAGAADSEKTECAGEAGTGHTETKYESGGDLRQFAGDSPYKQNIFLIL